MPLSLSSSLYRALIRPTKRLYPQLLLPRLRTTICRASLRTSIYILYTIERLPHGREKLRRILMLFLRHRFILYMLYKFLYLWFLPRIRSCWVVIHVDRHSNGRRKVDCWRTQSNNTHKCPAIGKDPRHIRMHVSKNKSNISGSLVRGEENLTYTVPCSCEQGLKALAPARCAAFKKTMKTLPFIRCPLPCAFQIMSDYIDACPDPDGHDHEVSHPEKAPLKLYRAITSQGDRRLPVNPSGGNSFGPSAERLNARLPEDSINMKLELKERTGLEHLSPLRA